MPCLPTEIYYLLSSSESRPSSSLLKNLEMESFLFLDDGVGVARWSL